MTSFTYDSAGNLTAATDPLGHQTTMGYNSAGQVTTLIDGLGNSTQLDYFGGDLTGTTDPLSNKTSRFVDGAGRLVSITDANGIKARDSKEPGSAIDELAAFIRELEYPSRDEMLAASQSAQTGSQIFDRIGCSFCHVRTFVTARVGTRLHGGTYTVPERLGGKTIHPFSDFLVHDVGTGDGIVQCADPKYADQSTSNKFRTAPLWGVRFRSWMMHDGKAVTYHQAIMRHAGEAAEVVEKYQRLSPAEKHELREFLNSL